MHIIVADVTCLCAVNIFHFGKAIYDKQIRLVYETTKALR